MLQFILCYYSGNCDETEDAKEPLKLGVILFFDKLTKETGPSEILLNSMDVHIITTMKLLIHMLLVWSSPVPSPTFSSLLSRTQLTQTIKKLY